MTRLLSTIITLVAVVAPTTNAWLCATTRSQQQRTTSALFSTAETETEAAADALKTTYSLDGEDIRGPATPLGNFVLVKTKDALTATTGGILLPDEAKERPTEGVVIAAGPGKLHPHTGIRIHNPVKAGDSVLYGMFDGAPIKYNDEECQMIRDDDVLLFYEGAAMTLDNVQPCRDYVLVELEEEDLETASGIVIAATVTSEDIPNQGIVAKVGEGRLTSSGKFSESPVQPGDMVKFKDYAGNEVRIDGKPYSLVKMVDILATLNV
eukprot:CAMPEP_0194035228 /NCGR_PEP_ID=MMETSP0009_2-20130614/7674_1 /TAXON_ID=210454 /ORGANISM="Grammatophora oceanica, Strain CCMP 410" /LENGTH=265 /DNA_ID=CAMNT_0038676499 /DNA_START=30 /DNA_END=827 /DNA_ORIENTATION=-